MTSFVDVTGGMNPLQTAQALNYAQEGTRNQIDWANKQLLRNLQSAHTNDDGSLDQFGFIHSAATHGIAPDAIKSWLDNQNATNAAATTQTHTNNILKQFRLNPDALRDQNKLPGQPGAGGFNSVDGVKIPVGQTIIYDKSQGSGPPTASPEPAPAPAPDELDNKTNAMAQRAMKWGKGSPEVASIQSEIGLTGKNVDGTWGPNTSKAYRNYLENNPNAGVVQAGSKLLFKNDVTKDTTTGNDGSNGSDVGTINNPAPYVKDEPHYNDTYYGLPQADGSIVPIKGSATRPANAPKTGATAFAPNSSNGNQSSTSGSSASTFAPKPVTGAKAMTETSTGGNTVGANDVEVKGKKEELNDGGTFTIPAPTDESMEYTSTPDKRSILERLADSGPGTMATPSMADDDKENEKIFSYNNVLYKGPLSLRSSINATLAKRGQTQDQAGVNALMNFAADSVPFPAMKTDKNGNPDPFATQQAYNDYFAKRLEAKQEVAKALADGNDKAIDQLLGNNNYALAMKKYRTVEAPEAARQATNFGEIQGAITDLKNKGYSLVTPGNYSEVAKVEADVQNVKGISDGIKELKGDLKNNPMMDKDLLVTRANTFLNRIIAIDGAKTEGASDVMLATMGVPKSIRQQIAEASANGIYKLPIEAVNMIKTFMTKNTPNKFINLLDETVNSMEKYGKVVGDAAAYGNKNPFNIPTPKGPGAFNPKKKKGQPNRSTAGM